MKLMIPENPSSLEAAEKKFVEFYKTSYFGDGWICYVHLEIDSYEPDMIMLSPDGLVYVIEIKNFKDFQRIRVENHMTYRYKGGLEKSPLKQAKSYYHSLSDICKKFNVDCIIIPMVCYPFINIEDFNTSELSKMSSIEETLLKDDFDNFKVVEKMNSLERKNKYQIAQFKKMNSAQIYEFRKIFESEMTLQINYVQDIELNDTCIPKYSFFVNFNTHIDENKMIELYRYWKLGIKLYVVVKNELFANEIYSFFSLNYGKDKLFYTKVFDDQNQQIFNFEFIITSINLPDIQLTDGKTSSFDNLLVVLGNDSSFNYEQYKLIHEDLSSDIIVTAGAGTGKTHSMLGRIAYILAYEKPNPKNINRMFAMITFTNEAAINMLNRIKSYYSNLYLVTSDYYYLEIFENLETVQIATIHKYVKSFLEEMGPYFGYGSSIQIKSFKYLKNLWYEQEIDRINNLNNNVFYVNNILSYDLKKICYRLTELIKQKNIDILNDDIDYGIDFLSESDQILLRLIIEITKKVEVQTVEYSKSKNSVLLSDIIIELHDKLNKKPIEVALRNTIKYLFIDEFQDTDDIQIDLFSQLSKLIGFKMFVVGDLKQCIYRFRGAEDAAFDQLISKTKLNFRQHYLVKNYRTEVGLIKSINSICSTFSNVNLGNYNLMNFTINDELKATKNSYNSEVKRIETLKGELYENIYKVILDLQSQNINDIAVLVRNNWQIVELKSELIERGLQVITETDSYFYNKLAVVDFYKLTRALLYNKSPIALYQLIKTSYSSGKRAVDFKKADMITLYENEYIIPNWNYYLQSLKHQPVIKVLHDIVYTIKPWIYSSDSTNHKINEENSIDYKTTLELLLELVVDNKSTDYLTLSKIVDDLKIKILTRDTSINEDLLNSSDLNENENKIKILTVHKSKGLEFDAVILPFMNTPITSHSNSRMVEVISSEKNKIGLKVKLNNDRIIKTNYFKEQSLLDNQLNIREEARILYVAMTRAKRELVLFDDNVKSNWYTWNKMVKMEDK